MKKLKYRWMQLPYPVRGCINVALGLLFAAWLYISLGAPTFTFQQEFRRAEAHYMIGPSTIVSRINSSSYADVDNMIVGETEHGVVFFTRRQNDGYGIFNDYSYQFHYREKTGDITILAAPIWGGSMLIGNQLPVYVFDQYPEATYADLSVTIEGQVTKHIEGKEVTYEFWETFDDHATRTTEGHFCFTLVNTRHSYGVPSSRDTRQDALECLSKVSNSTLFQDDDAIITATIRLYNAAGELLLEKKLPIYSIPNATHAQ